MAVARARIERAESSTPKRGRVALSAGLALAVVALLVAVVLSLGLGSRDVSPAAVLAALLGDSSGDFDLLVVRDLRLPRTLLGLAAGAGLGLAGAVMQGITRNPLADPGILGVNAGASLFVAAGITWFGVGSAAGYVWFALAGAAAAAALVYAIGARGAAGTTPVTLALAGTAVAAMCTSVITLILLTNLDTLGQYRFWAVGSLVGRDLEVLGTVAPFLAMGALLALGLGRSLNGFALGDEVATGLGQRLGMSRTIAAVAIVLLCGGATAVAGPIVFIGLVVPHLARQFTGPDYRWILAYSLVLGPALLVLADTVGRLVAQPGELEAGLVVAAVGAPVLIALVRRTRIGSL